MRHVVVRHIERPDARTIAALGDAGVSTVHEAMGRSGCMAPEIRPIQSGVRLAGPAVTVSCQPGDNLMVHAAIEVCTPGDVLVVTTTSRSTDGMVGELLATAAESRGVAAVVCDAGVRDVAEQRAMGFPVWSRAISCQGTVKSNAGSVNLPVVCAGVRVAPGDVVVADDDGVVVVPRVHAETVLHVATERLERESGSRAAFSQGTLSVDYYGLRATLEALGVVYLDSIGDDTV